MLGRFADQQKYVEFFWRAYLPHEENFSYEDASYTACGWTNVAKDIGDQEDVVKLAMAANCLCMLGSQHGETFMSKEGRLIYSNALGNMRYALQNPAGIDKNRLIIASRLLTLFMVVALSIDMSRYLCKG